MAKTVRKTTIKDLAQAAGTSPATASLVLNGGWKEHRINADTAERVMQLAQSLGYRPNQRARALRLNKSSLAGLIVPHHRNRFFAGLTEHFEHEALARGLVPLVASTQRDVRIEQKVADTMIAQEVEFLVLAGNEDPTRISALCREAGVRCVSLDLPAKTGFSVVTDNHGGARELTRRLMSGLPEGTQALFLGGLRGEYATEARIAGFRAALAEQGRSEAAAVIHCCGYSPQAAHDTLSCLSADQIETPGAILVNSITAFEGFTRFWHRHTDELPAVRVACFDWDPFAACLPFDTIMLRQDVEMLIARCFAWFDGTEDRDGQIEVVPARIVSDDTAGCRITASGGSGLG